MNSEIAERIVIISDVHTHTYTHSSEKYTKEK